MEGVAGIPEDELDEMLKKERLMLYRESNDSFKKLLKGEFGPLPLGFPADWVYESAFGADYDQVIAHRTEESPLKFLAPIDIDKEREDLAGLLNRNPTRKELVMYLNHPTDALNTMRYRERFGNLHRLPLSVWFEGMEVGEELTFTDSNGKPHDLIILDIAKPDEEGNSLVRYTCDAESFTYPVKTGKTAAQKINTEEVADKSNPFHVASPSNGDLWIVYVAPGDIVEKGEELFNITIMKQERAVLSPVDGMVKRVVKEANYKEDKKMIPVREGELIIELIDIPQRCPGCAKPLAGTEFEFCPWCGDSLL